METNHTPNLLTTKRLLLNRLLFIGLYLLTGTATLFSQTATVTVDCAATQGTLFRTEAYNNVPGKNTGASTRDSDYIFMNSQGLHAKVARVWLGEGDVYNKDTKVYNYTALTDYFQDVSTLLADEILINFTASTMIMSWGYTPAQCKPIIKTIIKYYKTTYPKVKYIECMNEPDDWGTGFTPAMVYPYYKVFYEAINELNDTLKPAIPLQIGGIALMSFKYTGAEWFGAFLDGYMNDTAPNKKIDFLSYHMYSYKSWPKELSTTRSLVESWLSSRGLNTVRPSFITEVGLFPGAETSGTVEDDALRQAAGMASCQYWLTQDSKNIPFNWVVRHANYERKDQLVTRPKSYCNRLTPYGNMMKMMGMMKTTKIATTTDVMDSDGLGVYGYAATDNTGVSIMAWNYRHTGVLDYTTTIHVNNLPAIFTGKAIRKKIYKIDQTTSNNYYDVNNCNLALISDNIIPNPGTSYTVNVGLMTENSLQLITLEPIALVTPTVNFTTPATNAILNPGVTLPVHVDATSVNGISNVQLYLNNVLVRTETIAPFDWGLTGQNDAVLTNMPTGAYTLKAIATGYDGASRTVSIDVVVTSLPSVNITGPINNSTVYVNTPVTITATATDADGSISKVDFYHGGTSLIGTDNLSPYTAGWTPVSTGTYNFTAKATDNLGTTKTSSVVSLNVIDCTYQNKIEAENYGSMFSVVKETCTDTGGGQDVGNISVGDWMSYFSVTIPVTGSYTITYRVASPTTGGSIRLEKDAGATLLGTVTFASTGGWQTWANASHTVTLPAGTYDLGLKSALGGFNLNWFEIDCAGTILKVGKQLTAIPSEPTEEEITVFPNPATSGLFVNGSDIREIEIYTLTGKRVLSTNEQKINLGFLPRGIYLAKIKTGNGTYNKKIIKE